MAEFTTPAFLQNKSEEDIFEMMKAVMPADIDLSEGSHGYNLTRPTALVAAFLCEYVAVETVKLIFPEWSYGEFLDAHARSRAVERRAATAATGFVTITGTPETEIPAGSIFATAAVNDSPSVEYETTEAVTIGEDGTVQAPVQCTQTGTIGNTKEGTVILLGSRITGISAVINEEPITGGTEEEDDDSIIARIGDYDKNQSNSYAGTMADYKRWALSVPGVGEATVIPANDDTGLVTIILTDANGASATQNLCDQVYNYIMRPDAPYERLAPINANLKVTAPATMQISIKATVELVEDYVIETVITGFQQAIAIYLAEAMDDEEIKYSRVLATLSGVEGVNDFKDLQIGIMQDGAFVYGTANIPVSSSELPTVTEDNLLLTVGTV